MLTVAYGAPPDDGHQIWPSGHLADWMVRVHDGPWSLVYAGLPERNKIERNWGTWDSNPGPEAFYTRLATNCATCVSCSYNQHKA